MSVDLRKIKKLIELLEDSKLSEIEIKEGENVIRLSRDTMPAPIITQPMATEVASVPVVQQAPSAAAPEPQSPKEVQGTSVQSPLVGTFYSASSPDAPDYVKVGDRVEVGDVLCILEAMKTFNQVEAEVSGEVVAINKKSGDPVEFGEVIFVIK